MKSTELQTHLMNINNWHEDVSNFIDSPEFKELNNKRQLLIMEYYNLLCAQRLMIEDLLKELI